MHIFFGRKLFAFAFCVPKKIPFQEFSLRSLALLPQFPYRRTRSEGDCVWKIFGKFPSITRECNKQEASESTTSGAKSLLFRYKDYASGISHPTGARRLKFRIQIYKHFMVYLRNFHKKAINKPARRRKFAEGEKKNRDNSKLKIV